MGFEITVIASGSTGNCYHITDGVTCVLLDAGVPIRKIREGCKFGLGDVSACLVTHSHQDHCKAVQSLLKAAVPVYMSPDEIDAAEYPARHNLKPLRRKTCRSESYGEYAPFLVGTFYVLPFSVQHDTPEPVGFLLSSSVTKDRLLYFTDTAYLRWQFSGITHIIGECNYVKARLMECVEAGDTNGQRALRVFSTHMSLETFLGVLGALKGPPPRKIYIAHMSSDHGDAQVILEAVQKKTGAEVIIC